jgi:outer membrane beta-barrel protein
MRATWLVTLLALVAALPARADDDGRLVVIQQRRFRLAHELFAAGTFEPQDAFSKGVAAEVGYTWHLSDDWAWNVARAGYLGRFDTGLKQQLQDSFGVAPTQFENLRWFVSSALVAKPLYGKLALANASVVHVEGYAALGLNVGRFDNSVAAGAELGLGTRVWFTRTLSLRLEARDALYFSRKISNVVFLTAGLSISLGGLD